MKIRLSPVIATIILLSTQVHAAYVASYTWDYNTMFGTSTAGGAVGKSLADSEGNHAWEYRVGIGDSVLPSETVLMGSWHDWVSPAKWQLDRSGRTAAISSTLISAGKYSNVSAEIAEVDWVSPLSGVVNVKFALTGHGASAGNIGVFLNDVSLNSVTNTSDDYHFEQDIFVQAGDRIALQLARFSGNNSTTYGNIDATVTLLAVPEAASLGFLLVGAVALLGKSRK